LRNERGQGRGPDTEERRGARSESDISGPPRLLPQKKKRKEKERATGGAKMPCAALPKNTARGKRGKAY